MKVLGHTSFLLYLLILFLNPSLQVSQFMSIDFYLEKILFPNILTVK